MSDIEPLTGYLDVAMPLHDISKSATGAKHA